MSQVPSEARVETKYKPIMTARMLCKHSLKVLANNRIFKARPTGDPEDDAKFPPQPELVARMRDTALDIYISAYTANETVLTKDNYRFRRQLQDRAVARCNELLALAELAIPLFHFPRARYGYWGALIVYTRNLIQKWKKTDYDRYRRM